MKVKVKSGKKVTVCVKTLIVYIFILCTIITNFYTKLYMDTFSMSLFYISSTRFRALHFT